MTERIRPSADWYRRRISSLTDDGNCLAGPSTFKAVEEAKDSSSETTVAAFAALVRLQRRDRKLSVAELALALKVEESDIRSIERDPSYRARPRTIMHIAQLFDLPLKELMKLAGAAASNDAAFVQEAVRFAAHSDEMGALSKEEKRLLRAYVEFLRDNN
ncbi:MAG: helix-turn-helix domain-containing protein [Burkholderiaceae bacterium]